jgi:hypothetical protein
MHRPFPPLPGAFCPSGGGQGGGQFINRQPHSNKCRRPMGRPYTNIPYNNTPPQPMRRYVFGRFTNRPYGTNTHTPVTVWDRLVPIRICPPRNESFRGESFAKRLVGQVLLSSSHPQAERVILEPAAKRGAPGVIVQAALPLQRLSSYVYPQNRATGPPRAAPSRP